MSNYFFLKYIHVILKGFIFEIIVSKQIAGRQGSEQIVSTE